MKEVMKMQVTGFVKKVTEMFNEAEDDTLDVYELYKFIVDYYNKVKDNC